MLFVSMWVILQNNARISDNVPDDAALSLLQIPRASRVLEAVILLALFGLHHGSLVRSRLSDFVACVWLFVLASFVSIALAPSVLVSQFQGIYVYVAPFLLFGWAVSARPTPRLVNGLIALLSLYLAVCVGVALFVQLPAVRTKSDLIHGLFSDAHVLGAYLAIFSCVAFSRFMAVGGVLRLLLAVALLLVSYFPANEKMIAFNLAWWAGAVAWRLMRHPTSRRGLTIAAAACGFLWWVAVVRTDYITDWFRMNEVTDKSVLEQGPVQAWVRSAHVVLDSPSALLVGIGPGNYAGVAAARSVANDPTRYRVLSGRALAALLDATAEQEGAIGLQANTWSNLLAEFGVIGSLFFGLALFRLSWPVVRWHPGNRRDALARTVFIAGLGAILWQGCVTPYTNWAEPVLVYPLMVVAAYCHAATVDRVRRHSRAAKRLDDPRDSGVEPPLET